MDIETIDGEVSELRKEALPTFLRAETFLIDDAERADGADERVYTFPFSSETVVERYFGDEVLSHDPKCIDLSRLQDGAPMLWNHNHDALIGVVERAWVDGKRGYVQVRFGTSPQAEQVLADVRAKVIRNVSVGYRILEVNESQSKGRVRYTATRWRPSEISLVSVPADPTVGLGRSEGGEETRRDVPVLGATRKENQTMTEVATPVVDQTAVRADAAIAERSRIAAINALGARFEQADLARTLIDGGRSLEEARTAFLEAIGSRAQPVAVVEGASNLALTEREQRAYSFVRAIRAQITGNWNDAGFERECSDAIAQRTGRESAGFFMPMNIRLDPTLDADHIRATYAVGAAGTGGNLVATDLMAGSFIELLRNRARVVQLGARMMSGLVGNVAIPRQATGATAYWVAEAGDVTQSEATFDQVTLTPKTLGARSQMTRQMMMQGTPDIEALARADLATTLALAIDLAAISGTGASNQPRGILNTSGIGSVVGGTNGAALTIDHLIDLETAVANANADDGSLAYLTNSKAVGALKKLKSTTGEYLWSNIPGAGRGPTPGEINGYPVARSNQVSSTGTKGSSGAVCSSLIYGNWSELLIGEWGVLEILANPFGSAFNSGGVDIRAMQSVDLAVRHAASFSAMTDALT